MGLGAIAGILGGLGALAGAGTSIAQSVGADKTGIPSERRREILDARRRALLDAQRRTGVGGQSVAGLGGGANRVSSTQLGRTTPTAGP